MELIQTQNDIIINKIQYLIDLSNDVSFNNPIEWAKWKEDVTTNQLVFKDNNYYYKGYSSSYRNGLYLSYIREKLAKIYREKYNIDWKIYTYINNNLVFQIEQREKLEICMPGKISFEDIFSSWNVTLELLEKEIKLTNITYQIKPHLKELNKIKLIRDCANNTKDYAFTPDKQNIILLDDTDFFLAFLDKDNNWFSVARDSIEIETPLGMGNLSPIYVENVRNVYCNYNKWFVFYNDKKLNVTDKDIHIEFLSKREQMLRDNISFLVSGKSKNKLLDFSNY